MITMTWKTLMLFVVEADAEMNYVQLLRLFVVFEIPGMTQYVYNVYPAISGAVYGVSQCKYSCVSKRLFLINWNFRFFLEDEYCCELHKLLYTILNEDS